MTWFRAQEAKRAEVGVYTRNVPAIAFYERHGFHPWTITLQRDL